MNITISQKKINNIIPVAALVFLIGAGGYYAWQFVGKLHRQTLFTA